ncbi:DNA methyltransferase [Aureimonas sp. AU12]|uniref:DNA methyltransferase n=1 Tax=Aureimonas sp. AU12 TaxID=1638161 RepID=UPI0009E8DA54|nr:DNA methyltransferase [Aureimonas sp. AU12]
MRHPLHSICPYFAMFPEAFVAEQLLAHTRPGELVLDPFCGRGTTILESLLNGRKAIGSDVNPVAACVAGAKADVPSLESILERISELEVQFNDDLFVGETLPEFFEYCFHKNTLEEIVFLKKYLNWQSDPVDRFISAIMLGILHGESHRSQSVLSNRMPRTISTKPDYSVRWWRERNLSAPERKTFPILREAAKFRFLKRPPEAKGKVVLDDARRATENFQDALGQVALVVTSPPYLDTTDYSEDQWLRLWFLGGADRPKHRINRDDRHTVLKDYWRFLNEVWKGVAPLVRDQAVIVVRIGGTKLTKEDLFSGVTSGLECAFNERRVKPIHSGRSSEIAKRQTNAFRPGTSPERLEHDFSFAIS